ncbi:hypothetical protein [uncultured Nostoc sp.]|uniref:hypothetical protein n=1 Tax=uncultured Nostoc sp. TaxID=340711 RepID=UPI00262DEDD1|nr:hypothetical protein [uncultured Nostoc sp.]
MLFRRCLRLATPTHLLIWRCLRLATPTHLLIWRSHLLIWRSHLLIWRSHLLFRRVHNAPYETTRIETYAGHTCVYTLAYLGEGFMVRAKTTVLNIDEV